MKTALIPTLFLAIFLISCKKEDEAQRPGIVNSADSIYVDKLVVLDTTRPLGMDTVEKMFFQYDNSKRIKSIFSYFVGDMDTSRQEFFYQGNDTLPFKEVYHSIDDHGAGFFHYVDTIYFNYANGVVSKDSILSWILSTGINNGLDANEFIVSGNTVKRISRHYSMFSGNYVLGYSDTSNFNVTHSAGNLATQAVTGPGEFVFVQATYDTKPNPLAKVFRPRYPVVGSSITTTEWFTQKNNPVHVQYQFDHFSPVETEQCIYTYNSNNYPSSIAYSNTEGSDYNKILYFYTAL